MSFLTLRSSKVQKGIQTAQQTRRENVRSEIGKQRSEGKEKPGDEYKFFFSFCCVSLLAGVRKLFVCLKGKTPKVKQEKSQTYVGRRQNRRKENCSKNARKQKLLEKWKTRQRTVNNLQEQLRNRRKKQTGKKRGKAIIRIVGKEKGGKKRSVKTKETFIRAGPMGNCLHVCLCFQELLWKEKGGRGEEEREVQYCSFLSFTSLFVDFVFYNNQKGKQQQKGEKRRKARINKEALKEEQNIGKCKIRGTHKRLAKRCQAAETNSQTSRTPRGAVVVKRRPLAL